MGGWIRTPRGRGAAFAAYLAALSAACVAAAVGASMLLPLLLVLAPAVIVLRERLSLAASLALVLVGLAWVTLLVFIASRYTGLPPLAVALVVMGLAGGVAAVRIWRRGLFATRADVTDLLLVGVGGIIWCGTLALAALLPDGSPVSWAMSGDAANNILFARALIEDGGVRLGGGANPVPLTASFLALFTIGHADGGVPDVGSAIIALTEMWSFGIVAACVMSGALALSLLRRRTAIGLLGVAISSALPVGWFMLSGPILLGFVNFHLTVALLVATLITLVSARHAALASLVTTSLALAATLALWAPLAGIPGIALLILIVVHRREVLALRRGRLVVALLAAVQPIAFFSAVSLPSLLAQGAALQEALGAVFNFPRVLFWVLLAVFVVIGAAHVLLVRSLDLVWVGTALLVGAGACLAALLWMRRHEADLWSYYQLKFLWFFMALLMIVGVAAGFAVATSLERRPALSVLVACALVVTVVGVSDNAKSQVPTFNRDAQALADPLSRILVGDFFSVGEGDRVFEQVKEMLGKDEKTIPWNSTDPDADSILFWVVQMSASSVDDVDLRAYAYYHDAQSMDDLCTVRRLMGPPVTVITADAGIAQRAQETCPELGPVLLEQ